jgi:hypothetical protein
LKKIKKNAKIKVQKGSQNSGSGDELPEITARGGPGSFVVYMEVAKSRGERLSLAAKFLTSG